MKKGKEWISDDRCFSSRRVLRRFNFVSIALRPSARSRLHFHAVRDRNGAVAPGGTAARWAPAFRRIVRRRFGPILATVLALAAASETIARGVFLLAAYSAGLAIPFLLTALGIRQFLEFYKNFRQHLHRVELFSGALLLFVGGLVFLNRLTWLSGKLAFLNRFSL